MAARHNSGGSLPVPPLDLTALVRRDRAVQWGGGPSGGGGLLPGFEYSLYRMGGSAAALPLQVSVPLLYFDRRVVTQVRLVVNMHGAFCATPAHRQPRALARPANIAPSRRLAGAGDVGPAAGGSSSASWQGA